MNKLSTKERNTSKWVPITPKCRQTGKAIRFLLPNFSELFCFFSKHLANFQALRVNNEGFFQVYTTTSFAPRVSAKAGSYLIQQDDQNWYILPSETFKEDWTIL